MKNLRAMPFFWVLCWLSFASTPVLANDKTPSHVYQMAQSIENSIMAIRDAKSITTAIKSPTVQSNKLPVHVYAKAIEVNQKIIRMQSKFGLETAPEAAIPIRKITPTDVYQVVSKVFEEVQKVTSLVSAQATMADFSPNKTPSNVYEKLMQVSYALDTVVGAINPNLVYRNAQMIHADIQLIAGQMGVALPAEMPAVIVGSKPYEVNIEAFKNLYRIAKLERKIGLKSVRVSEFPIGDVTPGEVYDTTNNLLAEITRIKAKMGILQEAKTFPVPQNKKPQEVRQLMALIGIQINALIK